MDHLRGRKLGVANSSEAGYRRLGRELASLHGVLERLPPRPQRPEWDGFVEATVPLNGLAWRAELLADLRDAAPAAADAFGAALTTLEARDLRGVFAGEARRVVHSDFSPWNVLMSGGRLSGVLDFELAHLDVLAADVAFARRGYHDAVVHGYLEVRPMPRDHLAALDGLWLGSLFFSLWRILGGWRRDGRVIAGQLDWTLDQLRKTRPFQPV
jgi:Ser/Thr protein kinase RdoA (MazF antagonist)